MATRESSRLKVALRRHGGDAHASASQSRIFKYEESDMMMFAASARDYSSPMEVVTDYFVYQFPDGLDGPLAESILLRLYPRDLLNLRKVSRSCFHMVEQSRVWARLTVERWGSSALVNADPAARAHCGSEVYRKSGWCALRYSHRVCTHTLQFGLSRLSRLIAIGVHPDGTVMVVSCDGHVFRCAADNSHPPATSSSSSSASSSLRLAIAGASCSIGTMSAAAFWNEFVCVQTGDSILQLFRIDSAASSHTTAFASYSYANAKFQRLLFNESFVGGSTSTHVILWRWTADRASFLTCSYAAYDVAFDAVCASASLFRDTIFLVNGRTLQIHRLSDVDGEVVRRVDMPLRSFNTARGATIGQVDFHGDLLSGIAAVHLKISEDLSRMALWVVRESSLRFIDLYNVSQDDPPHLTVSHLSIDPSLAFVVCGLSNGCIRLVSTISGRTFVKSCDLVPGFTAQMVLRDSAYFLRGLCAKVVHFGGVHHLEQVAMGRQALSDMFMGETDEVDPEVYLAHLRNLLVPLLAAKSIEGSSARDFLRQYETCKKQSCESIPGSLDNKAERVRRMLTGGHGEETNIRRDRFHRESRS